MKPPWLMPPKRYSWAVSKFFVGGVGTMVLRGVVLGLNTTGGGGLIGGLATAIVGSV